MTLRIALGSSSFRALREAGDTYVDKSLLIRDLIKDRAAAILLPRPRRFGKTTNLSMLRSYFEKSREPLWPLYGALGKLQPRRGDPLDRRGRSACVGPLPLLADLPMDVLAGCRGADR
jgi:hypothetical protein